MNDIQKLRLLAKVAHGCSGHALANVRIHDGVAVCSDGHCIAVVPVGIKGECLVSAADLRDTSVTPGARARIDDDSLIIVDGPRTTTIGRSDYPPGQFPDSYGEDMARGDVVAGVMLDPELLVKVAEQFCERKRVHLSIVSIGDRSAIRLASVFALGCGGPKYATLMGCGNVRDSVEWPYERKAETDDEQW